jgi:dipeptide/tripeptide permease
MGSKAEIQVEATPTTIPKGFLSRHPIGFWFFFAGEFAERASFYGMLAILTRYMTESLQFTDADAGSLVSFFKAGCYFAPLAGGFIADRYLGKYWTIVGFSLPYILGHVVIGFENVPCLFIAMGLLAMGSGVIKPNISTLMGLTYDQQRPGQVQLRSEAFSLFYGAINIGAFVSSTAVPWIRTHYNYSLAFLFPAGLMVVAFIVFASGKRLYAPELPPGQRPPTSPADRAEQWKVLSRLSLLFLLVTFFWAIFDQNSTTWIFFARDNLDLHLFGVDVDPDQVQALNPLFVIIIIPLLTLLWAYLARWGIQLRATDKMIAGFLLTAFTMAIHAFASYLVVATGDKVTLWWQVIAYLVLTVAEVLISVTGLELAFTAAPKTMKSFVTACWLLTVALANLFINAPVTRLYPGKNTTGWHFETPTGYFMALTVMMLIVTGAFFFVARRFNRELTVASGAPATLG